MCGVITEIRIQELQETMLKARDAKCSVPVRYGKVLFCGAAAAGKSNFLNLLMEEDFQSLHISTEVLKPQQVTVAMKAVISGNDKEVKFEKMNIDEEILQLESYLPEQNATFTGTMALNTSTLSKNTSLTPRQYVKVNVVNTEHNGAKQKVDSTAESNKLALSNISTTKKLDKKPPGKIWDILTLMDTGGQSQFISMLPAVNSFAMITFIIHKVVPGGQKSLNKIVKVQYGNERGEVSFKPHPHKYTYHQLIETLISYSSNILLPDTTFLDKLKIQSAETDNIRSILLVGTHCGDKLLENDITEVDNELTKLVEKSGINFIKPYLNKHYQTLVPVDNKVQGQNSKSQVIIEDTKRFTRPSAIRKYIHNFLKSQDVINVPINWLLLELEIRKVCQAKNCDLISFTDIQKLAQQKQLRYKGEFDNEDSINSDEFIKQGLRFHHSFGVLLYFEDVIGMQKLVITNHQWLFNKLSKIVEFSFTCDTQEEFKDLRKGIFKTALLASDCLDISKDFKVSKIDTKLINPVNAFLNLLQHLQIAAPLTETAEKYFMPCLLDSNDLSDLQENVPEYKASNIEPLLIQFKSVDNKTYAFPRGVFCFLIVELMLSMKWEPFGQAYVNLLTLCKKDTGHYITLIDRIFCLEVHVTYRKSNNIHDDIRSLINKTLLEVAKKVKVHESLCYGFKCSCPRIEGMHVSYLREDNTKYCWCTENSLTELTNSHTIWLKRYHQVILTRYFLNFKILCICILTLIKLWFWCLFFSNAFVNFGWSSTFIVNGFTCWCTAILNVST